MADKKITQLGAIPTVELTDVVPIVDLTDGVTKKVTIAQISEQAPVQSVASKTGAVTLEKSDVGLGNVDNTADTDKPISTATQTALNAKEATITATTTADYYRGDKTFATLNKSAVGLSNVDNTSDANKPVSSATQTALDAKQDTLVSGTNIKTINSTSILGSGDIAVSASPSGGAGAIQFSDGSAFASDSNFVWDNTNKRLGIGTAAPSARLQVDGVGSTSATTSLLVQNSSGTELFKVTDNGVVNVGNLTGTGQLRFLQYLVNGSPFNFNTPNIFSVQGGSAVATSGIRDAFLCNLSFAQSSGTAIMNVFNATPTINQTGGASGITRGLYVNPTLTSAADFRAIETTNGKVIFGNLPTSSSGLVSGQLWNDSGTLKIA